MADVLGKAYLNRLSIGLSLNQSLHDSRFCPLFRQPADPTCPERVAGRRDLCVVVSKSVIGTLKKKNYIFNSWLFYNNAIELKSYHISPPV